MQLILSSSHDILSIVPEQKWVAANVDGEFLTNLYESNQNVKGDFINELNKS